MTHISPTGVEILGHLEPGYRDILTHEALSFLAGLHRRFEKRRQSLLRYRKERQAELDQGAMLLFPHETADIRASEWKVRPAPADLLDRRVEITGPPDRKMMINALNSGAKVFMADFEDSSSPTWDNMMEGLVNVRDAVPAQLERAIVINHRDRILAFRLKVNEGAYRGNARARGRAEQKHKTILKCNPH